MFRGIEEVDWASLSHAHGPADDVPALLRALASADPVEREAALDALYGAVHSQGDVYDSTLACIPYLLELVADPAVRDRGCLVELLAGIGGIDLDGDDELAALDPEDEEFEDAANYAMASAAVAAGAEVFVGLLGDRDPEVRLAVPGALASLHGDPARVLGLLRERLTAEPESEVRLALVEAIGRLALRYASLRDEIAEWLDWLMGAAQDPAVRLAALTRLARCAPARLPADVVARVTDLLAALGDAEPHGGLRGADRDGGQREDHGDGGADASLGADAAAGGHGGSEGTDFAIWARSAWGGERDGRPGGPGGCGEAAEHAPAEGCPASAPTLLGQTRPRPEPAYGESRYGERAAEPGERGTAWADDLLRTLHGALHDRVADRTALVTVQLRSPERGRRTDALWVCGELLRSWRGSYDEVVRLIGAQLAAGDPWLARAAAIRLEELFTLARPAADALAEAVAAEPAPWAPERSGGLGTGSRALLALARAGDARAVPGVARALAHPRPDGRLLSAIPRLGRAAAPLVPALRRRLARLPLDDCLTDTAGPLLEAVAGLAGPAGGADALPEVLRVLRGAPEMWLPDGSPVVGTALRTLAAFGPAARGAAAGDLRALLAAGPPAVSVAAAGALWAVEGEAEAGLPMLRGLLRSPEAELRRRAARAVAPMGPAAAVAAPELRGCLAAPAIALRVDAAAALWAVTGRAADALPVLLAAWRQDDGCRPAVARCWAGHGPVPAEAAALLRAELARPRRYQSAGRVPGEQDVHRDEELLALCRRALGHGQLGEPGDGHGYGGSGSGSGKGCADG
ncbi:HEAT repeat domain-containing protein [Streptomyces solincola]|uniref:HEAT repeat domain-containing protein n=1 Tax=Streptomyces solincola TaxID=2100817 RepID=UPI000D1C3891|nr:HEAT repeat domain-containing protein [Streptomyces solincola]